MIRKVVKGRSLQNNALSLEKMTELEKSPFCNHQRNLCRQGASIGAKTLCESYWGNIFKVPTRRLLIMKRKVPLY